MNNILQFMDPFTAASINYVNKGLTFYKNAWA